MQFETQDQYWKKLRNAKNRSREAIPSVSRSFTFMTPGRVPTLDPFASGLSNPMAGNRIFSHQVDSKEEPYHTALSPSIDCLWLAVPEPSITHASLM